MESYFSSRFQRIVLKWQTSSWRPIPADVPQGSILGPLLFLIYINDVPEGLKSNAKLFADDTSFCSIAKNKNDSTKNLTHDLSLISKCVFKWKMLFNSDSTKPAQEVIFSRKNGDSAHPNTSFNDMSVERASQQKNLRIYLDKRLNFKMHIETVLCKVNKGSSIIKNLRYTLPRKSLLTIYKAFLRPHISLTNLAMNIFSEKLDSFQYKAALVITGAIQDTSRDKNLQSEF